MQIGNWISTVYFGTKAGTNSNLVIVVQSDGHFEQVLSAIPLNPIGSFIETYFLTNSLAPRTSDEKRLLP